MDFGAIYPYRRVSRHFFFVLSGFLITYLLLAEKAKTNTIAVKHFYMRRVLRIFPLYYFLILLGLFVFPSIEILHFPEWTEKLQDSFALKALLFLLLLPNILAVVAYPVPMTSHTWSIGVEEQFYVLWPFLMKHFKHSLRLLLAIILIYLVLAKGFWVFAQMEGRFQHLWQKAAHFLLLTRIDCMAIGGIGAYWVFQKHSILQRIYQTPFKLLYLGILLLCLVQVLSFGIWTHEIYALLFTLLILELATNPNTFIHLEHPILRYLGKISYGIYMYHFVALRLAVAAIDYFKPVVGALGLSIWFYGISFGLTILFAALSYQFLELPFLKRKKQFMVIESSGG